MLNNGLKLRPVTILCGFSLMLAPVTSLFAAQTLSGHPVHTSGEHSAPVRHNFHAVIAALPAGVHLYYSSTLASLYQARHMQPMWQDPVAVEKFQQQLAEVALSGVQPQFGQWASWLSRSDITGMERDVLLSDAMLGYLQFAAGAPVKGESWLYGDTPYSLSLPPSGDIARWQTSITTRNERVFIDSLMPRHPEYLPMQAALKKLLSENQQWPYLTNRISIRPGESSPEIPTLRTILIRSGMLSANAPVSAPVHPSADTPAQQQPVASTTSAGSQSALLPGKTLAGTTPAQANSPADTGTTSSALTTAVNPEDVYSPELVDAVKRFQQWQGLASDGVIGPRTREWLNVTPRMRAGLLALNIQRLRLLPDDMHNGIMVNIPNFSMTYYEDGKTILSSRVIVGRPDKKTPLMRSALNDVVLNPPWNVPTSLVRGDIVPKAKSDPDYLMKHGFTLLSGWSADAQVINPASINWATVDPATFPYRVRQAPGPQNALGRYKFNMPSSDAIYLHDTPNHMLFQRDIRALSSGCVRINKAAELAGILLKNVGWDSSRIASALQEGNSRYLAIRHRIPVNLYYLTAWVGEDGQPRFRTDIYNYDNLVRQGQSSIGPAEKLIL